MHQRTTVKAQINVVAPITVLRLLPSSISAVKIILFQSRGISPTNENVFNGKNSSRGEAERGFTMTKESEGGVIKGNATFTF